MRTIIVFFLISGIAFARPYMKCDCSNGTDLLIVNGYEYNCLESIDVEGLPNGITEIEVVAVGQSESDPFVFYVDKSENRKFEFYRMVFEKSQEGYFDKFLYTIKVLK